MAGAPRPSVLIVDDDLDVLATLSQFLDAAGFETKTFRDGAAAWSALVESAVPVPDVIILDHCMPEMNGVRFRDLQLKDARFAHVPVILYTASDPVEMRGALVMSKSTDPEMLLALVRRLTSPGVRRD